LHFCIFILNSVIAESVTPYSRHRHNAATSCWQRGSRPGAGEYTCPAAAQEKAATWPRNQPELPKTDYSYKSATLTPYFSTIVFPRSKTLLRSFEAVSLLISLVRRGDGEG
jgi:hypothetical protein